MARTVPLNTSSMLCLSSFRFLLSSYTLRDAQMLIYVTVGEIACEIWRNEKH